MQEHICASGDIVVVDLLLYIRKARHHTAEFSGSCDLTGIVIDIFHATPYGELAFILEVDFAAPDSIAEILIKVGHLNESHSFEIRDPILLATCASSQVLESPASISCRLVPSMTHNPQALSKDIPSCRIFRLVDWFISQGDMSGRT